MARCTLPSLRWFKREQDLESIFSFCDVLAIASFMPLKESDLIFNASGVDLLIECSTN